MMCHHITKLMSYIITSPKSYDVPTYRKIHAICHHITQLCDVSSNLQIHATCQNPPSINVALSSCNGSYTAQPFAFPDCTHERKLEFTKESRLRRLVSASP